MRDKQDRATFELPGFALASALKLPPLDANRSGGARQPKLLVQQHQFELLELLDETDATGLPVWRRDDNLDLTGLPIWAAA